MLNKRKYPKYILAYLLEKYPNKNWNWIYLADNLKNIQINIGYSMKKEFHLNLTKILQ
jgi:hypothetical protein